MKILVVCQYYYPEPFRITDICEALVNKGHNVTVLTGLPNYPEGKVLEDYRQGKRRKEVINGVRVIRSSILGRGNSKVTLFLNYVSFVISASLQVMLMKEKFDVVFVNQLSPVLMAIPAILYKKIHKRKILLYCLDLWPASLAAGGLTEKSIVYKIFLNISRWIYTSVDQILVTSKMFFHYFDEILKIDLNNIKHLPQYAEEDIFGKNVKAQSAKSDLFKFNFVFAGNIGDLQSVDTIVKAANELKSHQHIVLHIVGDGSKLSWCKQLSEELNLNNVFFHGRRPLQEMPQLYAMADAMLVTLKDNPILSYTLPGKVQSYMAAGKPIIGAINGEARLVIEEAQCGLCCPAEDYRGLSNLINEFINLGNKDRMAHNALNFYNTHYSKNGFIAILEQALMDLEDTSYVQ